MVKVPHKVVEVRGIDVTVDIDNKSIYLYHKGCICFEHCYGDRYKNTTVYGNGYDVFMSYFRSVRNYCVKIADSIYLLDNPSQVKPPKRTKEDLLRIQRKFYNGVVEGIVRRTKEYCGVKV